MPTPTKGSVRRLHGVAIARIPTSPGCRESFAMPTCKTEADASERARVLAQLAKRLRHAATDSDTKRKALELTAAAPARSLATHIQVIEEMVGGTVELNIKTTPTFKTIAEQWTSGELAQRFPDQIRVKRSAEDDVSRFTLYVYPEIGHLPIDRVTLDHCERVMQRLPATLAPATRRNVGQLMTRLLKLAVYPLRLIPASPIPAGFLPSAGKPKAMAYLYPDEDRRLLACTAVPLEYRILWGFLTREGMREGEALALTWGDLDLARGGVRLDKNKTDDPRAWALDAGVAAALRLYRKHCRAADLTTDRVFRDPKGQPIVGSGALGLPAMLRAHLRTIGLHEERPELFTSTDERRQIRVHDLRGTFVTVSLANGRTEAWVSARTGHRSSVMINRYRRTARTFSELQVGDVAPLATAVPEIAALLDAPRCATAQAKYPKRLAAPAGFEPASPT